MNLKKNPYLIAEMSGNHNGSIDNAKKIIKSAYENGADCIKLQTYTPDTMTIKSNREDFKIREGLWKDNTLWELYNKAHTPFEWHKELFDFAREVGIDCISSPFDETAVNLLESVNCPIYKVASFEIVDIPLIDYISSTKKPIIISTGMAKLSEIDEAVNICRKNKVEQIYLLHCVSGYPAPAEQYNLNNLQLLKEKFNCEVGLSDHTTSNDVALAAAVLGASIIEKHFTIDKKIGGPDVEFSMEPKDLKKLSNSIKTVMSSLENKNLNVKDSEKSNMIFRRSIYVTENIKEGEIFSDRNIRRIRPGYGLEPKYYNQIIGTKSKYNLSKGDRLESKHLHIDLNDDLN